MATATNDPQNRKAMGLLIFCEGDTLRPQIIGQNWV
jgi:hypothetical protein